MRPLVLKTRLRKPMKPRSSYFLSPARIGQSAPKQLALLSRLACYGAGSHSDDNYIHGLDLVHPLEVRLPHR
jgi:hypothetical protein